MCELSIVNLYVDVMVVDSERGPSCFVGQRVGQVKLEKTKKNGSKESRCCKKRLYILLGIIKGIFKIFLVYSVRCRDEFFSQNIFRL